MEKPKLKKYLAYYQKVLKREPRNIEARLRLASIFRDMGRTTHAVEEYVAASKLLANEGLPLEAMAACKAVLELAPDHTEIQYFLASLYARIPHGDAGRVARPLESTSEAAITLDQPKDSDTIDDLPTGEYGEDDTSPLDPAALDDIREERPTVEYRPVPRRPRPQDFYTTVDIDPEDILIESSRPDAPETFELGIFDLESLEVDDEATVDFDGLFDGLVDVFDAPSESMPDLPMSVSVDRSSLPEIPLFGQLSPEAFMQLLRVIEIRRVAAGAAVITPESEIPSLFVIISGEARVWRWVDGEEVELARLQVGEFFGEFMLLTGRSGLANVHASEEMEILEIKEGIVHDLGDRYPEIWDRLWNIYFSRLLNNLLASSVIFKPLTPEVRAVLARRFVLREFAGEELLLKQGDVCDALVLVTSGEFRMEYDHGAGRVEELSIVREGEFFGVASSLSGEPYVASVRALRDATVLCLPGDRFREIVETVPAVTAAVERFVSSRRENSSLYMSGVVEYAELGLVKPE